MAVTSRNRSAPPLITPEHDPHLWLEDVTGEDALSWVRARNARAEAELVDEEFIELESSIREILDASDRIPGVSRRGEHLYNYWTDAEHPQGLWRRTTLESYRTEAPEWDVLLDLDALSAADGVTWVWHGATVLRPAAEGEPWRHALISLSRGGSDADITREFDLVTREFVDPVDGGFSKPEGKGSMSWIDADTVYVATDQGEDAVTTSGYPRTARRWRRGTRLEEAEPVVSVEPDHMVAAAGHISTPGFERDVAVRVLGFYDSETLLIEGDELHRVEVPTDVRVSIHRDLFLFMPRTELTLLGQDFPGGSLVVADIEDFMSGEAELTPLFLPDASTSLQDVTATPSCLVLTVMEDVVHRVEAHVRISEGSSAWRREDIFTDVTGTLSVAAVDPRESEEVWITSEDHLSPSALHLGDLSGLLDGGRETHEVLKRAPERFDATGLTSVQRFATSDDGTRVPYFLIGSAELLAESSEAGPRPTVLYGYGGFEISMTPGYLAVIGKAWMESGGVYAVANIRGGGEYGPGWHRAALRENRPRAYEDFAAVARHLVTTGVTTVPQLACRGGSNGGLLTGNMLTQYPELFGAVVIQVPLLDMRRFADLLAGASWRAEYGDPETEDWEFMRSFSPYHLLQEGGSYPAVLLTTSTRDDRVHPGHARKMTAALESLGADVRYWENIEGGHGGAASPEQQARLNSVIHRFLQQQLR
ncbi:prolyl oligopeptidase family serine peptidase [Nesterenkonia xinjiangensis]|uniref:Prolyl oligopeptidase n=1 Tax=Nesterenkonia xinjiangensis TaxID=225327 RepID=A0A7Z0GMS9_9MICC|nr:prolyl oligopeptidase family serine peptidase [Nesterenkonia xinjiangensis]NYJ78866.1 prolyl oligopeptidase [Nesterenkonia xinjiangensis]